MKVGMHNWMRKEPIEVTLARLARYGYNGIEISGEPELYDVPYVKELLDQHRLECWGAITLMVQGRDLIAHHKHARAETVQYIKGCVDLVAGLGGQILGIVPGEVGKTTPTDTPGNEWRWAIEGLKEIAEYAGEKGIRPGIEPLNRFETYFINRHDQALALAAEVGNDMGVVLDAFHINIEEADPLGAIRATGQHLIDFHVADNNRMPAGMGAYDWGEVIRALRDAGYDGYLTSEFVIPADRTPCATDLTRMGTAEESGYDEEMEKFLRDHGTGAIGEEQYNRAVEYTITTLKQYL
jgi:D-psicose/D-tagatose/L-ribulose 3-epimerase